MSLVLIVEDSPTQAQQLQFILESHGLTTRIARDGREALALVNEDAFDLVLTDVVMPHLSGFELCRTIKNDPRHKNLPVIILTTLADPMDMVQALEFGADSYITKPYKEDFLIHRINAVLHDARADTNHKFQMGAEIQFLGKRFNITSEKKQILSLLISTFEDIVRTNQDLKKSQDELTSANAQIERYAHLLEGQVRISEEKYGTLMRHAHDAILICDQQGTIVEVNEQSKTLFQRPESGLLGRTVEDLVAPDSRDRVATLKDMIGSEIGTGPAVRPTVEFQVLRQDGSVRHVECSAGAVAFAEGDLRIRILRDVTGRRQAETTLLERERRLSSIYETTGDTLYHLAVEKDGKYRFISVNNAFVTTTGIDAARVVGKLVNEIIPEPSLTLVLEKYAEAIREQKLVRWEETSVYPTGRLTGDVSVAPVFDEAGNCTHLVGAVHDITKLKEAQEVLERQTEVLRASEQRHRYLVDALPHALVIVGQDGRITDVNAQTTRMFGYEREELLGQAVEMLMPESLHHAHAELRAGYLHNPTARMMGTRPDFFGLRKDGGKFPVDVGLNPERTSRGLEIICTIIDMTERRRMEAQMAASQKMETIGQLAGGVAHDFNNMLAVILSYANFVLKAVSAQDSVRGDVEEIITAANRSAALTRQLLAFSRRQMLKLEDANPNAVVMGMEKMLRRLIGEDVQLTTRLAPDLGIVRADISQMEQVFLNLAVNSRDAMPMGGQLSIETSNVELDDAYVNGHIDVKPGPYVMLSVSDNGSGMDKATQARLFEPFFTTKEQGKGTGLGLSTVYGIVKQLGGSIYVYSELKHGTTFKIYLPRAAHVPAETGPQLSAGRETRGTGTILLVEDEQQVRSAARRILESAGFRVLAAAEGDEALRLAEGEPGAIMLLLTDVVMPQMSGAELAERLLALRPSVRVLYMTGYTEGAISQHGVLKEGVRVVFKPFSTDSLLEQVRKVMGTT
ncbi:MAG: PAS domain S-box protein [Candidatus Lambdaproteobacteria bacterium]|nr:PAS domain S-box protein [Candidatus Lambdaproteobacteria bacterium]